MKWSEEQEKELVELLKYGKSYKEISNILKRSYSSIRTRSYILGVCSEMFKIHKKYEKTICLNCKKEIEVGSDGKKFCNSSCAAIFNNKLRNKKKYCLYCGEELNNYNKFCDIECQQKFQYENYIKKWKNGENNGQMGKKVKYISPYIRKYILEKYDFSCSKCGWSGINPVSKKYTLQIEHIDGNADNNNEENLTLLCPNCHSLTETFGSLNIGNGREYRRKNYFEKKIKCKKDKIHNMTKQQ